MDTIMSSTEQSIDTQITSEGKAGHRRVAPFVLPDSDRNGESQALESRLKYFTATSNAFKWSQTNTNSKTRKYLARNGFHCLFWSALLIDNSIMSLITDIFGHNIVFISDKQFESTFGMSLDTNAVISVDQLIANYFLLFSLPAKSHTEYLQEWVKRRLDAFSATILRSELTFDSHPELFVETKRRFYSYKRLVPELTRFVLNYFENNSSPLKELFRQIKIAITYSGLQIFYLSFTYSQLEVMKALELESVQEDIRRLSAARTVIIEKYGEDMLPFARLMDYPEVSQLNRCHYPDLAVCAHHYFIENRPSLANFRFRRMKTKTPTDQLKRLSTTYRANAFSMSRAFAAPDLTEEEKSIFMSLGIFPDNEMFNTLTTFVNPYTHLDLFDDSFDAYS